MTTTHSLQVITWNVNGLTQYIKTKKVICYLNSKRVDVALLQETHLEASESEKLRSEWMGKVYHSSIHTD